MEKQSDLVIRYIKEAFAPSECEIEIEGATGKGVGFVGDVIFAKAIFKNEVLHLAVKVSKSDPSMRKFNKDICQREVLFYNEIVLLFKQFQDEKNVPYSLYTIPKCYKAFIGENVEVIIQDNLKNKGFEMLPKQLTLNIQHIEMVLKNYARYHATSFALKDQKPEIFKDINENFFSITAKKWAHFYSMFKGYKEKLIKKLNQAGRQDLAVKFNTVIPEDIPSKIDEILNFIPEETVLIHGDCHIGNFLFQYKDNREIPSNMIFLDFQLACVHSPMLDVVTFLYFVSSKQELPHLFELVEVYYSELREFLSKLGSDVDKLYPKKTMWEKLRIFSFIAFTLSTVFLEILYVDNKNVPNMISENFDFERDFQGVVEDHGEYLERLIALVEFYLNTYHK